MPLLGEDFVGDNQDKQEDNDDAENDQGNNKDPVSVTDLYQWHNSL